MRVFVHILKKLLYAIGVLIGSTLLIFLLFNVIAEDPTITLLGKHATLEARADLRHELGLDRSLFIQYLDILGSVFTFNFGQSWSSKQSIWELIKEGASVSLAINLPAFFIGHTLVIAIALIMTKFRGMLVDRLMILLCVMMSSISALVYIIAGQYILAYKYGCFPISGYEEGFPACIPYIMLPSIILIVLHIGYEYRFYRTLMLDEVYQDYVRTARAKGLSEYRVLFKHVLKNVMIPIITIWIREIPMLIFGSAFIENFFSIPGLGGMALNALNSSDLPTIKAATVIAAVLSIIFNTLGDILYTLVDPRLQIIKNN